MAAPLRPRHLNPRIFRWTRRLKLEGPNSGKPNGCAPARHATSKWPPTATLGIRPFPRRVGATPLPPNYHNFDNGFNITEKERAR